MEWQAKALCGEVMILYDECKDMSTLEIVKKTNSSIDQARFFKKYVANKQYSRIGGETQMKRLKNSHLNYWRNLSGESMYSVCHTNDLLNPLWHSIKKKIN